MEVVLKAGSPMVVAHGGDRSSNLANASREALRQAVANGSVVSWQHMIDCRYSFADKAGDSKLLHAADRLV
jgi:hypothetical protein